VADDILIFGGSGSPKLTRKICEYVHVQPGTGKCFASRRQSVRSRQRNRSRTPRVSRAVDGLSANDNFMELLFLDPMR